MGLLDDLKSEADRLKDAELDKEAELSLQQAFYTEQLRPVMLRADKYFSELVSTLATVAPEVRPVYPLDPTPGKSLSLEQADYSFHSDSGENPLQVDVICSCTMERPMEYRVRGKNAVENYAALLAAYKFPHHRKNELDKRHEVISATFILEGPMKAQIRILADAAERSVFVEIFNIEDQPFKRYKLAPEKVNEALLDRMARLLVREESQLVEQQQISEDVREELRRKVEQDKRRAEQAQAELDAQVALEAQAEQESRLISRARRAVADATSNLARKISKK